MKETSVVVRNSYGHYPSEQQIRHGKERGMFAVRNSRKYDTTMAIYNTGQRLVICPVDMPANSYYLPMPWHWIRFADFNDDQGFLVVSERKIAGIFRDQIRFQTLGHVQDPRGAGHKYSNVIVRLGSVWTAEGYKIGRSFVIPPQFIQYICVHLGRVKDSLLVYAPLPHQCFRSCQVAERFLDQRLVLVK